MTSSAIWMSIRLSTLIWEVFPKWWNTITVSSRSWIMHRSGIEVKVRSSTQQLPAHRGARAVSDKLTPCADLALCF